MTTLKNNWKSKIDPAFDKVVKIYVGFLDKLQASPAEGRLDIPEDFIESALEKSDLPPVDLSDPKSSRDLFNYIKRTGGITGNEFGTVFGLLESLDGKEPNETIKICAKIIKNLPEEESRQFYNYKLESFKDNPGLEKDAMDFSSIIVSLATRYLYIILFEDKREVTEDIAYFKKSNAVNVFLSSILSSISQVAHQATLEMLKENILKGDDKSIFKAVKIDKNFLFMDEVKDKIIEAQLSGNNKFFEKLGKSIIETPFEVPSLHGKTYAALNTFWIHGLYKLTYQELYDFLISCGLIPPAYPYAFQKFISRNIKPLYSL